MGDDVLHQEAGRLLETPSAVGRPKKRRATFILLAGVLLPAAALIVELTLRICSSIFFDPIPTAWHIALFALIPVSNLLVAIAYLRDDLRFGKLLTVLTGASLGAGAVYSLLFLPMAPFSLLGVMCLGIGICGLSPFFGFAASILCSRRLKEMEAVPGLLYRRLLWGGIIAVTGIVGVFTASTAITNYGINLAASPDEDTSRRGVKLIRSLGSESVLLRACYGLPTDVWAYGSTWQARWDAEKREQARATYYKVTGRSFNAVAPPRLVGFRSELVSDFEFDSDVGGTAVNSRVTHLDMSSSRIDAVVDPDSLTAYTEWTLTFKNTAPTEREARAEIALPPGGVVSRLTLWVNGEEREAAFAGRGQVREAYQQVAVVQRRDPVLVTTCGPDRILMQCFPVPADGGSMKVRLGITAPLSPEDNGQSAYVLPRFIERNFGVKDNIEHSLYIESPGQLSYAGGDRGQTGRRIRTTIADSDLAGDGGTVICAQDKAERQVWVPDPTDPDRYAIVQTLTEAEYRAPKSVIVVLDASSKMRGSVGQVAEALETMPAGTKFSVIAASDEVTELSPMKAAAPDAVREAQRSIRAMKCIGGIDNRPAILQACDLAETSAESVVLWIHGPQPLTSEQYAEQLMQLCERRAGALRIVSVEAIPGRNTVLADLEKTGVVTVVPRRGTLAQDLGALFDRWTNGTRYVVTERERVPLASVQGVRGSSHIARLWARDAVLRICRSGDSRKFAEATALAAGHQLVTPVSGAVVLENAQQYADNDLKPVDPKSVPSVVPEPSSLMALGMGAVVLAGTIRRRRRSAKG